MLFAEISGRTMRTETIYESGEILIRRLVLQPGEAMPWHTDPCRRFSVVVSGECLQITYRDDASEFTAAVHPGICGWDEPQLRVHRARNTGSEPYEEIVIFLRESAEADPQPIEP
jgi:mannose-6-phosphate isomerase-like protein (cupin superfamily)